MKPLEQLRAWNAGRPPTTFLLSGWFAFVLGCYPGYLSVDSTLQFYEVRSGDYSDAHAALATWIWRVFEWVIAGPLPMLLLQSGLVLFGLWALLRSILTPRVAAVAAVGVLLFPPVAAPLAVIWPDPLMAGALLAGLAALRTSQRRWQAVGLLLFLLACNCRFACIAAIVPLLAIVPTSLAGWRRVAAIAGVAVAIEGAAIAADRIFVDTDTFESQQALMLPDMVSVLRRGRVTAVRSLDAAFAGVPIIDHDRLREITRHGKDPADWWALAHGDSRVFDLLADSDEAWALFRDWRHAIAHHPVAWLRHREQIAKRLLGINQPADAIFDSLGDFDLLAPLHHRAIPSLWERAARAIARAFDWVGLFNPWLYLVAAIVLLVREREPLVKALVAAGIAYELAVALFAGGFEYRFSHWLVLATTASAVMVVLRKRYAR
jgi:hypothetical protein